MKTTLDLEDLRSAHAAASRLLAFQYAAGAYDPQGIPKDHIVSKAIPALFAFDMNWKDSTVLEKYQELLAKEALEGRPATANLHVICVAGFGYWYQVNGDWKTWNSRYEYEEVLRFLSGIMNTYKDVATTRQSPRLGRYLV